jgi:hypothetical protein
VHLRDLGHRQRRPTATLKLGLSKRQQRTLTRALATRGRAALNVSVTALGTDGSTATAKRTIRVRP